MNGIKKWLLGNEKNIMRNSAVWNLISSVEYSLQSAILMMIITRMNGLFDAGIFMIAYTVTQMMATIGSYGMRSFQASDIKKEYSFSTYFTSRIVSVLTMVIICLTYSYMQGYDGVRMYIIIILCAYRLIEDIEDVFHGEMQKSMRLDVATKIVSVRIFLATLVFGIVYLVTDNLIIASLSLTLTALVVAVFLNMLVRDKFSELSFEVTKINVFKLLWVCLPICAGGFLYNYLVSAPKYAIDRNLSEEMQTIFNILFMPIFAINMLSSFIFKPLIVKMGIMWNENKKSDFVRSVIKQMGIIVVITIIIIVGGVLIGLDILGWLYKVELAEYRLMFSILILFGGFAAMVAFLVVVLTIIRQQKFIIVAYGVAVVVDLMIMDKLVIKYALWGAGIVYGIAMGIVMAILLCVMIVTVLKGKGQEYDESAEKNLS